MYIFSTTSALERHQSSSMTHLIVPSASQLLNDACSPQSCYEVDIMSICLKAQLPAGPHTHVFTRTQHHLMFSVSTIHSRTRQHAQPPTYIHKYLESHSRRGVPFQAISLTFHRIGQVEALFKAKVSGWEVEAGHNAEIISLDNCNCCSCN